MSWSGMMKKALLLAAILSVLPALVFAKLLTAPAQIDSMDKLLVLACRIAQWIFWFAIVVAVISVLYAAFMYLTSGGEEEKVRKAHAALTWVAVGVAVAILAAGVPPIVSAIIGEGDVDACPGIMGSSSPAPYGSPGRYEEYPLPIPI